MLDIEEGTFKPTAVVKKHKRIQFEHGNIYRFEIKKKLISIFNQMNCSIYFFIRKFPTEGRD